MIPTTGLKLLRSTLINSNALVAEQNSDFFYKIFNFNFRAVENVSLRFRSKKANAKNFGLLTGLFLSFLTKKKNFNTSVQLNSFLNKKRNLNTVKKNSRRKHLNFFYTLTSKQFIKKQDKSIAVKWALFFFFIRLTRLDFFFKVKAFYNKKLRKLSFLVNRTRKLYEFKWFYFLLLSKKNFTQSLSILNYTRLGFQMKAKPVPLKYQKFFLTQSFLY